MEDGSVYEGPFIKGSWHGTEVFERVDGSRYEGEFVNGAM